MGFFSNLYRTLLGINSEQTWKKIDWQGNEAVIAEKIKNFLALGADVNDTDCKEKVILQDNVIYKETPLAHAIKAHKFQVAELLVERGAKNDKRANVKKHFCLLVMEHNKYVQMEKMKKRGMDDPMMPFDKKFQQGDLEKMEHLM